MGPTRGGVNNWGVRLGGGVVFLSSSTLPALAADPAFDDGRLIVLSALATGAVALAIAASLWALAEQRSAQRLRRVLRTFGARSKTALGERDALLSTAREALVVWGRDGNQPFSYGGGGALLESCLKGPDALLLSKALDALSSKGIAFQILVEDPHGRKLVARGRAVGAMAAIWLEEPVVAPQAMDFRAILDALPIPVWLRDKALALSWANHAFLDATASASLDAARREQTSLDKSELDLAANARSRNVTLQTRRFAVVAGQRRAITFTEIPLGDAGIIGTAQDVTDVAAAEARLQQHVDAHADTLDKLQTAVAIFGKDQKLSFYNRAFVKLWGFPEAWLDRHPSDGEILDRLREMRRLPEQRDYQAWKRQRLSLYQTGGAHEDVWHTPGGRTIRVVTQPHPFGGLSFLYEDVTEKLALESSYNTLIKVQSATLDTLVEGVAVFGPDGRLKLHNAAFARIWDMSEAELSGDPHVRGIAENAIRRFGDGPMWDRLIQQIVSGSAQQRDMGEIERSDRSILALALSPLPDGATLVTFADVSDRFRIESALRDRGDALEAADKLKSEFIKHVSYELRTPLNTILGFSEHLASGVPGALNPRQSEYVDAIVTGASTLKDLVNDILDLALVESGALRLELERIDLYGLLADVAVHAGDWAAKMNLNLELDCVPGSGVFLADQRRMRQIVFNLLSNAFKFTPGGGNITLSGRIVGDDVQIAVRDNGPGLPADVKANVFERFSARSQGSQRAGAGLGLALVNRFMELHDGWVEIESNDKSGGTLVRCHVPRRIRDTPHPDEDTEKRIAYL
ncbi:MAG TPA: PAS-domain containing protein [Rhizomicrobium sp.]|nr:PAS-domain containing protein [Rhizomicrobium sp.]